MAEGYWVGRVEVFDTEAYKVYQAANATPFKEFGGRFLARRGRYEKP
ncbi:DUF1330 domain-containing protein [Rhodoferax sp.]